VPKIIEGRPTIGTPSGTNHKWYPKGITIARQKHGLSQIEERRIAKYLHRLRVEVQKSWRFLEVGMG
jgi:hypothetical protein